MGAWGPNAKFGFERGTKKELSSINQLELLEKIFDYREMQPFEGMGFPAVEIEHSFAKFLGERIGKRGEPWDADAFRGGYIADIGKALQAVAARLRLRCNALSKKIVNGTGYDVTQLNRLCDRLDEVATQQTSC